MSGSLSGELVSVNAITNSFHAAMNVKMNAVTIPGSANGRTTLKSVLIRPQPSMAAASSISSGMLLKKLERIQIEKARLKAL